MEIRKHNGILVAYYLTYTRLDDTKDSKTIKTTKTEVVLTGLKLGKTYSFVVRDQFVQVIYTGITVTYALHFETTSFIDHGQYIYMTLITARFDIQNLVALTI